MNWNINFNKSAAENIYYAVERHRHLTGFLKAEDKLNNLKSRLENLLSEIEWVIDKCKKSADHYAYMQKELQANPEDFSDEHAREVSSKSPQILYEYVADLNSGASKVRDAINAIGNILDKIKHAENEAEEESKKVLEKITHAIELMDSYLRVSF